MNTNNYNLDNTLLKFLENIPKQILDYAEPRNFRWNLIYPNTFNYQP